MYAFHLYFDYCATTCFWPANKETYKRFGVGPIDPDKLHLSAQTIAKIKN